MFGGSAATWPLFVRLGSEGLTILKESRQKELMGNGAL